MCEIPDNKLFELYESAKQAIIEKNLSPQEYESEIRKLTKALGI